MRPKNGSDTWARTRDKLINSQLLYQLSYVGIKMVHQTRLELAVICLEGRRITNYATDAKWVRGWELNPLKKLMRLLWLPNLPAIKI